MAIAAIVLGILVVLDGWETPRVLARAEPAFVIAAFVAYAVFFVIRGIRWAALVRPYAPGVSMIRAASLTGFGWLVSTFVPMKAGDVARAALLARHERANAAHVVGAVAIERVLDVFGLAAAASFGLLAGRVVLAERLPAFVANALIVAWVLPLIAFAALVGLSIWLSKKPDRPGFARVIARFAEPFRAVAQDWRRLPLLVTLTLLVCAAQITMFTFVFLALDPTAWLAAVIVGVPLFLLTFIASFVPGNVGTYEAGFVVVFTIVGFDPGVLLGYAVAAHVMTVSFVTVLGSVGYSIHRLLRTKETESVESRNVPA